ncbi:hypothetical protein [Zavarzinia sp.]|uniref:hypothetical protein n=1 Tax=Zavarzinia sp. TaxID=2027920 RepID=UPI0035656ED0
MTASRNRRGGLSLVAAAALLAAGLPILGACGGGRRAPPTADTGAPPASGPLSLMTAPLTEPGPPLQAPGPAPDTTDPRGAALPAPVAEAPLSTAVALSPAGTEALQDLVGGAVWAGSDAAAAGFLLDRLPVPARSAAARALTRRLIAADPPWPELLPRLVALRAATGDGADLARLAGDPAAMGALPHEAIAAVVQALAASPDRRQLCGAGLDRLADPAGSDSEVLRAVALCRVAAGDGAGAQLMLDMARDRQPLDPGFEHLFATMSGGERATPDAVKPADALSLWAGEALALAPAGGLDVVRVPVLNLGLLARGPGSLDSRIAAAERGVAVGVVAPSVLATLYETGPAPAGAVTALPPGLRRQALHRVVVEASGPAVRAQAVAAVVEAGAKDGLAAAMAAVEGRAIADVAAQSLPPPIGAGLVRAALWAGDIASAKAQLDRLGQVAGDGSAAAVDLLWPYRALLAPAAPLPGGFDDFTDALPRGSDGTARLRLTALLLDALGAVLPDLLTAARGDGVAVSISGPVEALIAAGRRGEALASVLALLGDRPLAAVAPDELAYAVSVLRRIGLGDDARALAVEAALAAGL